MKLRAAEGLRVRDPETFEVLVDGEAKPLNTYWRRRLVQGDVLPVAMEHPPNQRPSSKPIPSETLEAQSTPKRRKT